MRGTMGALVALGLAMSEAQAAELPKAPAGYRVGNGIAIGGAALVGLSAAGMAAVAATCNDPVHGCAYSYIFLLTMGVAPGMAVQPLGAALGYRSLRKHGYKPSPWGMYTMAAGASLLATVPITNAAEAYDLGTGLAIAGIGLLGVGGIGQLVTNVIHFETAPAELSLRPWVNREQAGLALVGRW
jgi:hypothetical protein